MQETLDYLAKTLVLNTFLEIDQGHLNKALMIFKVTLNCAGKITKHINSNSNFE